MSSLSVRHTARHEARISVSRECGRVDEIPSENLTLAVLRADPRAVHLRRAGWQSWRQRSTSRREAAQLSIIRSVGVVHSIPAGAGPCVSRASAVSVDGWDPSQIPRTISGARKAKRDQTLQVTIGHAFPFGDLSDGKSSARGQFMEPAMAARDRLDQGWVGARGTR